MKFTFIALLGLGFAAGLVVAAPPSPGIRKIEDVMIYADPQYHSAFPSIVRRPDGELVVAFRRAPDRRLLGDERFTHADPNSYLMLVRSQDAGRTWTKDPQMFYAHPFGGSQDPCLVQLSDASLICASYGWAWMPSAALPKLPKPHTVVMNNFVFLGGYLLKSADGGKSWSPPIIPPRSEGEPRVDIFGKPLAAFNRGAMCEGRDGRLYWATAASPADGAARTEVHLMISADKGVTWKYSCPIARDARATFNETSLYETPKGDLVAFLRTAGLNDHLVVARSTDHGKSFQKWEDGGFQGHPFHATRLPDNRVLLVYGYRHPPYGIRARVLDAECLRPAAAPETVLRDDGGGIDLGYPWATMVTPDRALVVYYFNRADGTRTIEGTFVQVE
ncbi:MAG: sialidase family protein [Verrucomicrobia bacterium]|nr:sialidase family protein [Verrucomicrobiota bacterium]